MKRDAFAHNVQCIVFCVLCTIYRLCTTHIIIYRYIKIQFASIYIVYKIHNMYYTHTHACRYFRMLLHSARAHDIHTDKI